MWGPFAPGGTGGQPGAGPPSSAGVPGMPQMPLQHPGQQMMGSSFNVNLPDSLRLPFPGGHDQGRSASAPAGKKKTKKAVVPKAKPIKMKAEAMNMGAIVDDQLENQMTSARMTEQTAFAPSGQMVNISYVADADALVLVRKLLSKDAVGHGGWTKKAINAQIGTKKFEIPSPVMRDVKMVLTTQKNVTRQYQHIRVGTDGGGETPYADWLKKLKKGAGKRGMEGAFSFLIS